MVRVGKDEIVSVLRVDKDKGYIDLSKRRVNDEDRKKCENRYEKAKVGLDLDNFFQNCYYECLCSVRFFRVGLLGGVGKAKLRYHYLLLEFLLKSSKRL